MQIDLKTLSEATLQAATVSLENKNTSMAISAYYQRSASQDTDKTDDISSEELAQMQIILIQEAARDVGLDFNMQSKGNITEFKEKLKNKILEKAEYTEDALKALVCEELQYCEKVGKSWRAKLLFGAGLALASLLVDITGISLAGILYLLSIGYFDELCECNKAEVVGA